jgi:hypothetical protein
LLPWLVREEKGPIDDPLFFNGIFSGLFSELCLSTLSSSNALELKVYLDPIIGQKDGAVHEVVRDQLQETGISARQTAIAPLFKAILPAIGPWFPNDYCGELLHQLSARFHMSGFDGSNGTLSIVNCCVRWSEAADEMPESHHPVWIGSQRRAIPFPLQDASKRDVAVRAHELLLPIATGQQTALNQREMQIYGTNHFTLHLHFM